MLDRVVIDDTELFNDRLQEWESFYNFNRPHGGLGGRTPYERLRKRRGPERERTPSAAQQRWCPRAEPDERDETCRAHWCRWKRCTSSDPEPRRLLILDGRSHRYQPYETWTWKKGDVVAGSRAHRGSFD